MKQSELNRILDQHKLWLESNGNKGKRANLSGANLSDADLRGADLGGADLTDSILNSKYMSSAKVSQSQLSWLATDPNFCDWIDKLDVLVSFVIVDHEFKIESLV